MLFFVLFSCAASKNPLTEGAPSVPILPAPQALFYSVKGAPPSDVLVSKIADELNWSEALSGAAAELGLNYSEHLPQLNDARWAAIRAGFPYHVSQMIIGDVEMDERPKGLRESIIQLAPKHLGLVRVRKGTKDRWVALIGESGRLSESFPREVARGGELIVEGQGKWRMADPSGTITEGELPFKNQLSEEGEWWMEMSHNGVYASIPIYVGIGTPISNLFVSSEYGIDLATPSEVEEEAYILIEEMRIREGVSFLNDDKMLISLSQYPLQYFMENRWDSTEGVKHLQKAGFVGGPTYQIACEAENALLCLDNLSWDIESRQALLDPQIRNIGLTSYVDTSKVALMINLSSQ